MLDQFPMHTILWYILTFVSPLFGVAICTVGGVFCYRWARSRRIGRVAAVLGYLFATSLPIYLTAMSVKLGIYLADRQVFIFHGEATWLHMIITFYYVGFAILSNLALWVSFTFMRLERPHP